MIHHFGTWCYGGHFLLTLKILLPALFSLITLAFAGMDFAIDKEYSAGFLLTLKEMITSLLTPVPSVTSARH